MVPKGDQAGHDGEVVAPVDASKRARRFGPPYPYIAPSRDVRSPVTALPVAVAVIVARSNLYLVAPVPIQPASVGGETQ